MLKQKMTVKELTEDDEFRSVFRNVQQVYRAVAKHGLPCWKPMGVMLFDRREVRNWVERSRCNAEVQQPGVLVLSKGAVVC